MDTKANLSNRKKINELAVQHNKLTTLVACLLNEVHGLKRELKESRGGLDINRIDNSNNSKIQQNNNNPNKFPNFSELRAEDILKQLSFNNSEN
jgi:hypothetical protein